MLNPFQDVNWNPDTAARRKFAVSLVIGFPCIAILIFLADRLRSGGWHPSFPLRMGFIGAAAGAIFYLLPIIAKPFYLAWYALACCIGLVLGNLLMGLIFFVLVTGIGLLMRLGRKQPIVKHFDRTASTYWIDAPPAPKAQRYFSQY